MPTAASTKRQLDLNKRSPKAEALFDTFKKRIIGQEEALEVMADIVERHQAGLCDPSKPAGNALFLGPTGTGKTYVCETLCEALVGNPRACIKIDCAEFQHSHEIAKLVGSPPGYLGHRETRPMLTQEALNQYHTASCKLSILLLDEVEKASDALWTLMLGILDKAKLTLGDNRIVDFKDVILVMTSNLGVAEMNFAHAGGIGIRPAAPVALSHDKITTIAREAAKRKFSPEFLNRIDHQVVFRTLSEDDARKIMDLEIERIAERIYNEKKVMFFVNKAAKEQLLKEGFSREYGARNMKRTLEKNINIPITRFIGSGQVAPDQTVIVGMLKGTFDYYVLETK